MCASQADAKCIKQENVRQHADNLFLHTVVECPDLKDEITREYWSSSGKTCTWSYHSKVD